METAAGPIVPASLETRLGRVEYAAFGEGPAVLALHGAMGGYDQSALLARTIGPSGYRYLAVSRPGFLGTPLASGRGPEQQADLCAALLDALGLGDAAVMAVSGGGPCALHFALRHRARCRALVLVSTCGGKVAERVPLSFRIMQFFGRFPPLAASMSERFRRRVTENFEAAARRSIPDADLRARTLADPEAGPLFRELTLSTFDRLGHRLPGTANDIAVTRVSEYPLEEVGVPTLIVHGTLDHMVPFAQHGQRLAARIPGAELLALEGADHVGIFTHHAEVVAAVARFMARHSPARG